MNKKITCPVCPMACEIQIEKTYNQQNISGNRCGRGYDFAKASLEDSKNRIVTGRCLLEGGQMSRLPVRTSKEINMDLTEKVLSIIQKTTVTAPVKKGQVIIENILNTGVDVISQRKAL